MFSSGHFLILEGNKTRVKLKYSSEVDDINFKY